MRRRSGRSGTISSIVSPSCSLPCPQRPVTRDQSPSAVRDALGARRAAARNRHHAAALLAEIAPAAVRSFAVQRASPLLRLHHRAAGADRSPRRLPGLGAERQRRRVAAVAGGHRDRGPDGALDCRVDRLSAGTAAGCWSAAATWRTSSACSRRARPGPGGTCAPAAGSGGPAVARAYASAETHTWIQKAADIAGLGTDAIRWIRTDGDLRMDVAALTAADRA